MTPKSIRIALSLAVGIAVVLYILTVLLGDRLNDDQTVGCIVVGLFILAISTAFFLFGGLPFRSLTQNHSGLKRAYRIACLSFLYGFLQIPVWSAMTMRFPPDHFTETQSVIVAIGVLISFFGPAAPRIFSFYRAISYANRQRRESLSAKKANHDTPQA